jgi:hypothetical protein
MITTNLTSKIVGLGLAAALAAAPGFAAAATYAYVDVNGEVRSVVAGNWQTAIATAPNIAARSGVILIDGAEDSDLIGDSVTGA